MSAKAEERMTKGLVLQEDDGSSFWQPVPANGYVTIKLTPENWDGPFSMGFQIVAVGSHIRKHAHDRNLEVLFVWQGKGRAIVGESEYPMLPGTIIMLPKNVEHMFINEGEEELKLVWTMSPHGLEDFFSQIGRPRTPQDPVPENFPRPADVLEIERRTVFSKPVES
ncbi:mannose-6-phosphate isomerase-like protein (cupin superfamily) [Rhodoligotrophos appendicifer]|uniref:cupin domain-containing protein n=1 Tax=Rhodoligotrophos appendicifer TaxID=987056 RepID=UPI0014796FDD|nr:cupin domain-containing protein [Rhodoligotrophos appendicifer]